ncbi:MAG: TIGR01459 family HAD-type hydrolase [Pseudomonadota bacterium]
MSSPEILNSCGAFLSNYRAIICDIWGVLHDGITAYDGANAALSHYREKGGRVVLLSNSPQVSWQIETLLKTKNVSPSVYDSIVTSGDITIRVLNEMHVKKVFHIGPGRHDPIYDDQPYIRTALDEAEAIVCTGYYNDDFSDMAVYMPIFEQALARKLPFVCANPDLVVDVGGVLYPCAGTLAQEYEQKGGVVHWAGKPHQLAFQMARDELDRVFNAQFSEKDILVIGDTLRTDIAGAAAMKFDALFIAQGIHREEISSHDKIDAKKLETLYRSAGFSARAAAFGLQP